MKAKLKDGFEVSVNDNILNDWRFLTLLRKIDKGDTALIVDATEILLGGSDEVDRLAEHFEENDGHVPADAMISAFSEILESVNELKNSLSSPA